MSVSIRPEKTALTWRSVATQLLQTVVMFFVIGGALLGGAGRLDWWEAWAFLIGYFLIALTSVLWMLRTQPELARERQHPGQNMKKWDNVLVGFNLLLTLTMFAVIGLDVGRYGGSQVPLAMRIVALLGFIPAFGLPLWASRANAYLSSRVRIQEDRGHVVVSEGPYRYVRHPMYAGMVLYDLSVPLLLGSWWGLAVGVVMIAVVVVRTALEDRTLQQELPGYDDYTQRVRYRLLPGVW
ncbi:MAG: isoprenylcysteine carboxylmethyltransferase family protein [Anaerolineae bacterium]|nr:isoprenylcysteine carboxylmethyltransferase family protein [Anaerolineae bacterium]